MSIGDIIVLGIVAAAVISAAVRLVRKKNTCGCGCDGCTAGCDRRQTGKTVSGKHTCTGSGTVHKAGNTQE